MNWVQRLRRLYRSDRFNLWDEVRRNARLRGRRYLFALPPIHTVTYRQAWRTLQHRMEQEGSLDDVLDTVYNFAGRGLYRTIHPLQDRRNLAALARIVADYAPETVMEIGTAKGGTLYVWCRFLDADQYISVDNGYYGWLPYWQQIRLMRQFAPNKDMQFIIGDSHAPRTRKQVRQRLDGRKIDFLFLDGDHSYEGVKKDFELYQDFLADDAIIAFDDIDHPDYGVSRFWDEMKEEYATEELTEGTSVGTGVVTL